MQTFSSTPDVELLVPDHDEPAPKVSIVIPALDEELTISEFVTWCQQGLEKADISGEILIIDSGHDRTTERALAGGARVLRTPKRGLGRAYIDAMPFIRGEWVIMGDADCTYDFRNLSEFIDGFAAGFEFVMGSRWKGSIEPGAMPWLHQYAGTPVTTKILNVLYSTNFSDIHCGMRGITRDALDRMQIQSQSWDYASEMVLRSVHMGLRTTEVPVHFLKDPDGRVSHHVRGGWFSPWQAAWINLRTMFIHGADSFVYRPGFVMAALGLALTLPMTFGPVTVGGVTFSLYWMLGGLTLAVVGVESFFLGCLAQVLYDDTGHAKRRWLRIFPYTRTTFLAGAMAVLGVALVAPLVIEYLTNGLRLPDPAATRNYMAVTGILAMIIGFTTFASTLLLHAVSFYTRPRNEP